MGMDWGAVAGGLSDGLHRNRESAMRERQVRLQEQRDARDNEMHGFRVSEAADRQDDRTRLKAATAEAAQFAMSFGRPPAEVAPPEAGGPGLSRISPAAKGGEPEEGSSWGQGAAQSARDPDHVIGSMLYSQPDRARDPKFLNGMMEIYAKHGLVDKAKPYWESLFKAEEQKVISTAIALTRNDPDTAFRLNQAAAGRKYSKPPELIQDGPDRGKWRATFQDGQSEVFDARAMFASGLLEPGKAIETMFKFGEDDRKKAESDALVAERNANVRFRDAQVTATGENSASQSDYRSRMAGAAEVRANRAVTPSAAMSAARSSQVSREVERALTTSDGDGKGVLDRERAPFYKSIASQLAKQDPALTASEAADIAMSVPHITPRMATEQAQTELRDLRAKVGLMDKAAGIGSGGGFQQAYGMSEDAWTKGRVAEIVRKTEAEADAKLAELGVTRRRGGGASVKPKVTQEAIAALRANPDRADDFRAMFGVDPAQYIQRAAPKVDVSSYAAPSGASPAGLVRRVPQPTAQALDPQSDLARRGGQVFARQGNNEVLDKKSTIDGDPRVSFLRSDIANAIEAKDMAKVGVLTKALNEYVSNRYGGWQ